MIGKGTWKARGVEAALGIANTGTEQVAVLCEFLEGPHQGERITWYGFLTDAAKKRTIESLIHFGVGNDLTDLSGVTTQDVYLVVDHEEYQGETHAKVKWVNSGAGGALAMKATMDKARAAAVAQRLKGDIAAARQAMPKPSTPEGRSGGTVRRSEGAKPWEDESEPPF